MLKLGGNWFPIIAMSDYIMKRQFYDGIVKQGFCNVHTELNNIIFRDPIQRERVMAYAV